VVVRQGARPERPENEDAPQLSDAIWELAEKCWVKNPKQRPTASAVCDSLSHLRDTTSITQPIADPFASHPAKSNPLSPLTRLSNLTNLNHLPHIAWVAQPVPERIPIGPIGPAESKPLPPTLTSPQSGLTQTPKLTLRGHSSSVCCATFSPDGKYIVSGSNDRTIIVWDAQTGNPALGPLKMHASTVSCVAFSPDGKQIVSGSSDNTVLVWDAAMGKVVKGVFKGHSKAISFSPNGKQIASCSAGDNKILVWDTRQGNLRAGPLTGHTDFITSVVFSGDGKLLVSGSADKTIRVWKVKGKLWKRGRLVCGPLKGHIDQVSFVALSPDGKRIVSASCTGDVCVFDTETGALLSGPSKQHAEHTLAVAFAPNSTYCAVSPDGRWIAARVRNAHKIVRVWDSKTGLPAVTFTDHSKHVNSVTFSPDSKRLISSSFNKTIRVHTLD
jgi:WD40 repeat protein